MMKEFVAAVVVLVGVIAGIILVVALLCGCISDADAQVQANQLKNVPIKIAESNGVIVWKVRDETAGGRSFVYYTTPSERGVAEINSQVLGDL